MTARDDDDDEREGRAVVDVVDRWALGCGSVAMSLLGCMLTMLMLGSLFAGAEWLAPLLSMAVLALGVMGIGLAVAAIIARRGGGWAALAFALLPCGAVLLTWAWALRHGRWG